jgi:cysteinyl-tRNA synthetase
MREIVLHDTRSGELMPLRPRDPGRVGVYACGPTVYSRIHIGNARPFVVFALLKRFLEHEGYTVDLVVNVTDVNDKIYDAARQVNPDQPPSSAELAAEMTRHYRDDTDALGLGRPDHEPLASETIGPIVEHIQTLIDRGHAYAVDGDVYFRVRSDPGYGTLSHRQLENMDQGEAVADADELAGAVGRGAARLAHRVLGDGRAVPRRRLRRPWRRL